MGMTLYLNLVALFLKRNTKEKESPIYTLKYYGVHIHVHLCQKVN